MPSDLPLDCRKILSRWAHNEFYCYMRPMTSRLIDAKKKHTVYWVVNVEYRTMPPGYWREEGFSLAEVIRKLDKVVPKKRREHARIDQKKQPGWLAAEKAQRRAIHEAGKARRKTAATKPTKRKKPR